LKWRDGSSVVAVAAVLKCRTGFWACVSQRHLMIAASKPVV